MKKILSILMAMLVLATFAIFAVGSSDDDSATVSQGEGTTTGDAAINSNLTVNPGDVLNASNLEITYNSCGEFTGYSQYLAPADGNKIIYIDISAKNTGDSDAYISYFDFNCYADDAAAEAYYGEDDGISATLSAGRSTSGKVYFEVPKNAEKIEIEYETDYWDNQKAIFVVE